ncbi:hypothetical protein BJ138DRAFT_1164106 [Hygrophoropsis aurantiaca]|uniref:Uncharacterized protein n=1 Tax=Hygrophoropsis aurantiaca TaxID=72124 RepID=A0ACB7ZYA7_9AGAM|nr:hypothetical protein BJ138DRAFT_1164106 [Hygrophoropsis aurantiaca]
MQAILLTMRAYALCGRSRIILYTVVPCFCLQAITVIVMTGMAYTTANMRKYFMNLGSPIGSVTQSATLDDSAFQPFAFIIPALELAFDIMLFASALYGYSKHAIESMRMAKSWSVNPLVRLLVTTHILYFLCYLAFQAISFVISDPSLNPVSDEYADLVVNTLDDVILAVATVIGPRMVLSLRAQHAEPAELPFDAELTTIQFSAQKPGLQSRAENFSRGSHGYP